MRRSPWLWMVAIAAGCTPAIAVRPNPGPAQEGLRFYRPKPYLLVEPAPEKVEDAKGAALDPRGKLFKVSLHYLPDFGEEYALQVRTGLGTCKVNLKLEDGWNLTELNQDLDSKTSDTITAATGLLKDAVPGGLIPLADSGAKTREGTGKPPGRPEFVVHASNVPLGYYESVIGRDPHTGRKHLYGFRYVGFLPFAPCPIQPAGEGLACCADGSMPLYGLVFENEVMTFKPLPNIALEGTRISGLPSRVLEGAPAAPPIAPHAGPSVPPRTPSLDPYDPSSPTTGASAPGGTAAGTSHSHSPIRLTPLP